MRQSEGDCQNLQPYRQKMTAISEHQHSNFAPLTHVAPI